MNYIELEEIVKDFDICIWGYGRIGKSYPLIVLNCFGAKIICFCDTNYKENESFEGIPLVSKDLLFRMANEKKRSRRIFVFVAIKDLSVQDIILKELNDREIRCDIFDSQTLTEICSSVENSGDMALNRKFSGFMEDSIYLKKLFRLKMHRELDLSNPKTFNEKIQWLKLNERNCIYPMLADKAEVKNYVANKMGYGVNIVPTIGVWDCFDDIDFKTLPNKFVLKCTHDSGSVVICRDKESFDKISARKKLSKCLKQNWYYAAREWAYKSIKPRIIVEEYINDDKLLSDHKKGLVEETVDYKFYCFNGEPEFLYVSKGFENHARTRITFMSKEWNLLPFGRTDYKCFDIVPKRPSKFNEMLEICRVLSQDMTFVRVDLYESNNKVYFSEFTLYPCAGLMPFNPTEYDLIIGEKMALN